MSDDPKWQPISTAPRDGTRLLLWAPSWSQPNTGHPYPRGWGPMYELGPWLDQPTHWMPLPEPPRDA